MSSDPGVQQRCRALAERTFDLDAAALTYDRLYAKMLDRPSAADGLS